MKQNLNEFLASVNAHAYTPDKSLAGCFIITNTVNSRRFRFSHSHWRYFKVQHNISFWRIRVWQLLNWKTNWDEWRRSSWRKVTQNRNFYDEPTGRRLNLRRGKV